MRNEIIKNIAMLFNVVYFSYEVLGHYGKELLSNYNLNLVRPVVHQKINSGGGL